jgi:hypothetical protein
MKLSRLVQIIKEEVSDFFSDWAVDEPSVSDKYYEKQFGIDPNNPNEKLQDIDAEVIGFVDRGLLKKRNEAPIGVYKNPKTLDGFGEVARGILLNNTDFYLARTYLASHEMILELMAKKGIIPHDSQFFYDNKLPKEFVAVQRQGVTNTFVESDAYHMTNKPFPDYYLEIFRKGSIRQPFRFQHRTAQNEQQSPLDPNRMQSNIPQGHDPNILYESNVKKD